MNFDKDKYKVWQLPHPMVLHWVMNPGLAFNELILGQRLPKVMLVDKTSDAPLMERQYVPCPECNVLTDARVWGGSRSKGASLVLSTNMTLGSRCPRINSLKASPGFITQCNTIGCGSCQTLYLSLSKFIFVLSFLLQASNAHAAFGKFQFQKEWQIQTQPTFRQLSQRCTEVHPLQNPAIGLQLCKRQSR
jgi:hypothetical protein